MNKRLLPLLLAALLLTPAMAACGETTTETTTETSETKAETAAVPEEELSDYEKRQRIPDDLPENDFGGQAFRVLATAPTIEAYDAVTFEIIADELTGDACNDAVYNRNIDIGERFNMTFTMTEEKESWTVCKNSVLAGTDDYDLAGFYNYMSYQLINAKALLNWMEIPHVNLEKPWHNALSNANATINNTLYAICSDLAITSMTYTYAIYFNQRILNDHGYAAEDMYDMVRNGSWTIDKMDEIVTTMYVDVNGDGKADTGDNYGFGYNMVNPTDVWEAAFDLQLCSVQPDNSIEVNFMSDKTMSVLEKLIAFHYENPGYIKLTATQYEEEEYFLNGQLAMAPLRFAAAYSDLREMDDAYSMLPWPKWDEAQKAYYTNADDKFTAFGVPLTAFGNVEFVGTIFEALCAESYKKVYPAYYDIALKGKYSTDAGTAEMVDLIMAGRNFDFSFQFGESHFQRLPYLIRDLIVAQSTNLASKWDSIEGKMWTAIEKDLLPLYGIE
ncbi:MAG: hypothetical protein IJB52_06215 [Clostridia bacterium]|nr:hypothetical protein [Clostridia bacterium]